MKSEKAEKYHLDELDVDRWQQDLREDRKTLENLLGQVKQIDKDRDAKLAELKEILKRKIQDPPVDKEGHANRKALVFTTFGETATYLYDNLEGWARDELGVHIGQVGGSDNNRSSVNVSNFLKILERFSPVAQQAGDIKDEDQIDILIATDCLSEGQNLQDCDWVVNYDIHWNPVRVMQRFGRVDRLGSLNKKVSMTNFWPTPDLEQYLALELRVKARMALVDATGTGLDDPLDANTDADIKENEMRNWLNRKWIFATNNWFACAMKIWTSRSPAKGSICTT